MMQKGHNTVQVKSPLKQTDVSTTSDCIMPAFLMLSVLSREGLVEEASSYTIHLS